jgi:hypothetical protein
MPITQTVYTVGTALVQVIAPDTQPQFVTLHNLEDVNGRKIYIGNGALVAGQSVEINPAVYLQMTLGPGDNLFAVTDGGNYQLGVMIQKQD